MSGLYGLALGAAGVYFAWVADMWARVGTDVGWHAFDLEVLFDYMKFFYEKGFWSMEHGQTVSGPFLAAIWLAEAGVIVGMATWAAYRTISWLPFCEPCECWTTITKKVRQLIVPDAARLKLSGGDLSVLEECRVAAGHEPEYLQFDLARCPKCEHTNLLSVHAVTNTLNKKGEMKATKKVLLKHLVVSAAEASHIGSVGREWEAETEEETN